MAGGYILKQVPLYPVKYVPPAGGGFFPPGPLGGRFFPRSLVVGGRFLNITKNCTFTQDKLIVEVFEFPAAFFLYLQKFC